MSDWSFIAQRATTREFLDWDVPLTLGGLEWELSGPGSLKATISPDVGGLRASDGRPILEEWGTLLHAEHEGFIRWSGIVISCSFSGEVWNLEAAGFGTYPHAVTYGGDYSQIGVDPATVIRHLWDHVQSYPDADLGVVVTGATSTGTTLGTPATPQVVSDNVHAAQDIEARIDSGQAINLSTLTWDGCPPYVSAHAGEILAEWGGPKSAIDFLQDYVNTHPQSTEKRPAAQAIHDRMVSGQSLFEDWTWNGNPPEVAKYNDELHDDYDKSQTPRGFLDVYLANHANEIIAATDADPYTISWTESTNCGEEIDTLAKGAPLDWVEHHYWADEDRETLVHEVELAFPRAGRRREDIVFVQGDNIVGEPVTVESNGDDFANTIVGLGAGEGLAMIHRETSVRDGRLRRVSVYADKAITDPGRMDSLIAEELNARRAALRIESINVMDHPNAPLGSWQLGDDVLVRAELPWLGEIEVWCRITGWSLTGENTASLTLVRSDLYRYGGVQ